MKTKCVASKRIDYLRVQKTALCIKSTHTNKDERRFERKYLFDCTHKFQYFFREVFHLISSHMPDIQTLSKILKFDTGFEMGSYRNFPLKWPWTKEFAMLELFIGIRACQLKKTKSI